MAWKMIAWLVSQPMVAKWIIARAMRTPYSPITSRDGSRLYMERFWLFNPYSEALPARWSWLPSIRVHHIRLPDDDPHLHDHPWNARTIIMDGWYIEEVPRQFFCRLSGYTGRLLYGQFHRIETVAPAGAWTLFITWKYRGTWGFDVDGVKVPYKQYFKERNNGRHS